MTEDALLMHEAQEGLIRLEPCLFYTETYPEFLR